MSYSRFYREGLTTKVNEQNKRWGTTAFGLQYLDSQRTDLPACSMIITEEKTQQCANNADDDAPYKGCAKAIHP